MNNIAFLSLGSNQGDRFECLMSALRELSISPNVKIDLVSSIYETDPVGYTNQANFLNMAVKISTSLTANNLLQLCLNIESKMGRVREFRWGPRIIDLDILLYNNENIEMEALQVPHPRLIERAFVLIPLVEIDRNLKLPHSDTPLVKILDEIPDKEGVRLWRQINGEDAFVLFES